jgi:hypothetical protein
MARKGQEVAIYTNLVYGNNDTLWASAHHTEDEAWEHTREWLIEEMGGTEIEQVAVTAMTNEQVWDTIMDYDYIAFADIAVKKVLY